MLASQLPCQEILPFGFNKLKVVKKYSADLGVAEISFVVCQPCKINACSRLSADGKLIRFLLIFTLFHDGSSYLIYSQQKQYISIQPCLMLFL